MDTSMTLQLSVNKEPIVTTLEDLLEDSVEY